jgi:hypothetical protein
MALVTIPIRDKKMIIWNFMEELWRKHQEATNDGRQPAFHINEFKNIDLFEKYLPRLGLKKSKADSIVLDTLLEYEQRGYYKTVNDIVTLTDRGLAECRKPVHDWDKEKV